MWSRTVHCFPQNGIWVRALPGPMHLGHKTGPLCPLFCTKLKKPLFCQPSSRWPPIILWEPCYSAKFPDDPQTYTLDVLLFSPSLLIIFLLPPFLMGPHSSKIKSKFNLARPIDDLSLSAWLRIDWSCETHALLAVVLALYPGPWGCTGYWNCG